MHHGDIYELTGGGVDQEKREAVEAAGLRCGEIPRV